MEIFDNNKFHWKRILVIMLFMTSISIFMGKMPNGESNWKEAVNEYSKKCPIVLGYGLSLDSVHYTSPKILDYYISDKSGAFNHLDSTNSHNVIKSIYQGKNVNSDFIKLLDNGYIINILLFRQDNSLFQFRLDSKTFENYDQEI